MTIKHIKKCTMSLIFREINLQTNELSPNTGQNGHHLKKKIQTTNARGVRKKGNPPALLVGM